MFNRRNFVASLLSLLPIPFLKRKTDASNLDCISDDHLIPVDLSSLKCVSGTKIKCNDQFIPELVVHFNAESILDGMAAVGEKEMAKLLGMFVISECRSQWNIVMPKE